MSGVTQKIRRFTGGISDQPDEQKLPGQVRDAVNCTPDVVYGLLKRPGTNLILISVTMLPMKVSGSGLTNVTLLPVKNGM